ncbi:unnamed protein product [Cylindrotheca closterium]|uniref:Uncharacterized protein n=1 Tax=Cylindrotheca closterium TaxID=2856 RepID=A0AAD2CXJ2_9STRA|nr:unnamed protein product [Cylindrotheca closterium]
MCYDHSSITALELRRCLEDHDDIKEESLFADDFRMSPFHILFSTVEPRGDMLEVLLKKFPYHVLGWKDADGKLAMDYLVSNWTYQNKILLQMALQSWIFGRLERWCDQSWRTTMIPLVNALLAEGHYRKLLHKSEEYSVPCDLLHHDKSMKIWRPRQSWKWPCGKGK